MPDQKVLRFGVICQSSKIEDWKLRSVIDMQKKRQAELSLIIKPARIENSERKKRLMAPSVKKRFKSLQLQDLFNKYTCIPVLDYLDDHQSKEQITKAELDFIIDFDGHFGREFTAACKYGVWAFQLGDEQSYSYGSSCFWEIYNNESVTAVSLYRYTEKKDEKILLKKGYFATIKDSYMKNKDHICSSVSTWPSMVCKDLLNGNAAYLNGNPAVSTSAKAYGSPTPVQWLFFYRKLIRNKIKKLVTQLFCYEYWNVGLVNQSIENLLNETQPAIKWLVEKKDLYYADPFGYEENGRLHILMEELDHKVVNGYISKLDVNLGGDKEVIIDSSIIRLPSHMSYPYILHHEEDVFCIPETSEENEVAVYQLNKTTKKWIKARTILEGFPAVDATIIKHEDKWWMFCTRGGSESQTHNSELHLFYAEHLFGEWKAHKQNPVKIDIRSSRPAGTPFYREGALYRPAQDCSETYGGRIVLNKIKTLTTSQFIEEPASRVQPEKNSLYPDGVHTLSSINSQWTLIDGKRFDYSIFHLFKKLHKFKPVRQLEIEKYPDKHVRNV